MPEKLKAPFTFRHSTAVACLIAGALLAACGKEKEKEKEKVEAPTPVTVETAVRGAIDHMVTADAVLYPVNQANVVSKITAPVKRMLVNRGDHVRAGQVLAELESGDLAAAANETKSQYEQAQAGFETTTRGTLPEDKTKAQGDAQAAQQAFEAAKKLYENRAALQREGALAQKLVDDARVAMAQAQSQFETAQRHLQALNQVTQRETARGAQAQVNAAKAHYENAAVQLSYAVIRSPIGGVVADRSVYPGGRARERSSKGSSRHQSRPAGANYRTVRGSGRQGHGRQSLGRRQRDDARSLGTGFESG